MGEDTQYKDEIKLEFFKRNFYWTNDYRDYPGYYVKDCIREEKVKINDIYEWLNEYISLDNEFFINECILKISKLLRFYNIGISKDSILVIYNLIMSKQDYIDKQTYLEAIFLKLSNNIENQYGGLLPYLKFYGLNEEFNNVCKVFENVYKSCTLEYLENMYFNAFLQSYEKENNLEESKDGIRFKASYNASLVAKKRYELIQNNYNNFVDFINMVKGTVKYTHIAKSNELLLIEYKFDGIQLTLDKDLGVCKLYTDD